MQPEKINNQSQTFLPVHPFLEKIKIKQIMKTSCTWNGQWLSNYFKGYPEVTMLKITLAPGERLPVHMHPVISSSYILSGELTVVSDAGEKKHFKKGDAFVCLVDQYHYGKNDGREPVEILVNYVGEKEKPVSIVQKL